MRQLIASDAATSGVASTHPLLGSTKWLQVGKSEPSEPAFHAVQHFQRDTKTTIVSPAPIRCVTRPLIVPAMCSSMVVAAQRSSRCSLLRAKNTKQARTSGRHPANNGQQHGDVQAVSPPPPRAARCWSEWPANWRSESGSMMVVANQRSPPE